MPTCVFGQAVDDKLRALFNRLLPQRAKKGVIDGDGGFLLARERRIPRSAYCLYIDQSVGRVGGAFQINECDFAAGLAGLGFGAFQHRVDFIACRSCRKVEIMHAKTRQYPRNQRLGRCIKGPRMDDHIVLADQC